MTDALDQAALEAARKAYLAAEENPNMVQCPKCNGRGYHHGFGENGADPDWCSGCGGGGYDLADGEQNRPLDEAIRAYLAARSTVPEAGKAVDDIVAERQRQISSEGWTTEHDDEHDKGEMARAAACYAYEATRTEHQRSLDDGFAPPMWPWAERWWKPTDRRRDLVKAAALIIAEIERLDRAAKG